ncbi:sigma-E factor negative regulatory protein [Niveibacterium sp. COAC-50]|uniref:sigma-E factor negative regulatory protein n=1 Tax=Niveibacterium sp. COAC-50 TaxID=2729384 RepID=UPI0015569454|nr:sigma-E factor negative regulatory protein [Niveibacterium sp. COAC-50]
MKQQISALLDGELEPTGVQAILSRTKTDPALRECWGEYALIGDALRGETELSSDFTAKFMERLEAEPTVLAPAAGAAVAKRRSALDTLLPIAATVAGVAVVAWLGLRVEPAAEPARVARAAGQVHAVSAGDADRAYLLAHHGYAGAQAVPGVGYYMRTAAEQVGDGVQ